MLFQNLRSKLFGRENKENGGGVWVTRQYREIEDMLARERATNRHLQEQLARAQAEVVALTASGEFWLGQVTLQQGRAGCMRRFFP